MSDLVVLDRARARDGLFLNGPASTPNPPTSFASTPDHADLDITGDIDIRVAIAFDDWTPPVPTAQETLIGKYDFAGNQRSFRFVLLSTGILRFQNTEDGASGTTRTLDSSVAPTIMDRQPLLVRVAVDVDNGSSQRSGSFYAKPYTALSVAADLAANSGWTLLGSIIVQASNTSIFSSTAPLLIGAVGTTSAAADRPFGRVLAAVVKSGIDGTTVFAADFTKQPPSTRSFTEETGKVVSVNGSAFIDNYETGGYLRSLRLDGSSGCYASTPSAAALDITGDIDLRAAVALDDWTPAGQNSIFGKNDVANQRAYDLRVQATTGVLLVQWTTDGTVGTATAVSSTVAPTVVDGALLLVRSTVDVNNGAGGTDIKFFTKTSTVNTASADLLLNTGWTQLGTTVTLGATTSIFASTSELQIGATNTTLNRLTGRVFAASVHNGIDGTAVFSANFNRPIGEASFTEDTGKVVTLNGTARYAYEGPR